MNNDRDNSTFEEAAGENPGAGRESEASSTISTGPEGKATAAARVTKKPQGYVIGVLAKCIACDTHIVIDQPQIVMAGMQRATIRANCGKCGYMNELRPLASKEGIIAKPTNSQIHKLTR